MTRPPPRRSTLNADGTPLQLSLTLGWSGARLEFLSDVGEPALSTAERMVAGRVRVRELAELIGAQRAVERIEPLVDTMAPAGNPQLLSEPAGAFWIGAGFAPGRSPTLKLYVNARWGEEGARWARLAEFAARLGAEVAWREVRELVAEELEPLGVALAANPDGAIAGRIYVSGYGKTWEYLEALGRAYGGAVYGERLRDCAQTLLADDHAYPTRSVVCSFELLAGRLGDVKVELCGHCAFDSDRQARERCEQWLRDDQQALDVYTRVTNLLSGGSLSATQTTLHSYMGLGSGHSRTLYFNPAGTRPPDGGA